MNGKAEKPVGLKLSKLKELKFVIFFSLSPVIKAQMDIIGCIKRMTILRVKKDLKQFMENKSFIFLKNVKNQLKLYKLFLREIS